jgi:hypothetical protein
VRASAPSRHHSRSRTKLAAWRGLGHVLRSLCVHDIVVLINGRSELADELAEGFLQGIFDAPGRIRTSDPRIRSPAA